MGQAPRYILVIDIGGTNVKMMTPGRKHPLRIPSGPTMTAKQMVEAVLRETAGWKYSVVSIGYPGPVRRNRPVLEPHNLGRGWVRFDYAKAFGRPVRIINDAAMQALGSYQGGRMLFLGLGAGLGAALVLDGVLQPMELAHLPYQKGRTYEDYLGLRGLRRMGRKKWRKHVRKVIEILKAALEVDYVVLGGGNARLLKTLPAATRRGHNRLAFRGGFQLWCDPSDRG
jgi:predicted NBD/HSP70 family sugar kinase